MSSPKSTGDTTSEHDSGDDVGPVGAAELSRKLRKEKLTGPEIMALCKNLDKEMIDFVSPDVSRLIGALKNLQKDFIDIEAEFFTEVHALECKYSKLFQPIFDKRAQIVNGLYKPTDEECVNSWTAAREKEITNNLQNVSIADSPEIKAAQENTNEDVKGIPHFWYNIFRNVSMLADMMHEHDEPIIKCLQDIKVQMQEDPIGFTLEFHFEPNDYFTNTVLTKQYFMKCKPDEDNPMEFEGPEIYSCKGCEIDWKKGKNVTIKTIKKKQKHKSRGSVRTVTKSVQADSFFNFFAPPQTEDPNETNESDIQAILTADFEIGHYIRERVVSRAVLLYTGEGLDEEDDDYDDEEEEEDSYSDEDSGTEEVSDPEI